MSNEDSIEGGIFMSKQQDVVLETIVFGINAVNSLETSNITLFVNGLIISGNVISKLAYLTGIADSFENDETFKTTFSDMAKSESMKNPYDIERSEEEYSVKYIHLKNAKLYKSNSIVNLGLWRGKISSVDGFNFRTMESE